MGWSLARANGVWHAASYNSRLQPAESYDATNNTNSPQTTLFVSCPNWGVNSNAGIWDICPHASQTNDNATLQGYAEFHGGPGYAIAKLRPKLYIRWRKPPDGRNRQRRLEPHVRIRSVWKFVGHELE